MSVNKCLAEHPDLIAVCMNCTQDDCRGECLKYRNKYRELMGAPKNESKYNRKLEAFGKQMTLNEWAEESGIPYHTLHKRMRRGGMTLEEALNPDRAKKKKQKIKEPREAGTRKAPGVEAFGRKQTLREWAAETGIDFRTLQKRIQRGMTAEEALTREVCSGRQHLLTYNGETHNLSEWARLLGCSRSRLSAEINRIERKGACCDGANH